MVAKADGLQELSNTPELMEPNQQAHILTLEDKAPADTTALQLLLESQVSQLSLILELLLPVDPLLFLSKVRLAASCTTPVESSMVSVVKLITQS